MLHGFTVSRGWWGNVVKVRCTEVVYILEERERESARVTDLQMLPIRRKWTETHDHEVTLEKTGELLKTAKRTTFSLFSF